jgi:hypothetical protein
MPPVHSDLGTTGSSRKPIFSQVEPANLISWPSCLIIIESSVLIPSLRHIERDVFTRAHLSTDEITVSTLEGSNFASVIQSSDSRGVEVTVALNHVNGHVIQAFAEGAPARGLNDHRVLISEELLLIHVRAAQITIIRLRQVKPDGIVISNLSLENFSTDLVALKPDEVPVSILTLRDISVDIQATITRTSLKTNSSASSVVVTFLILRDGNWTAEGTIDRCGISVSDLILVRYIRSVSRCRLNEGGRTVLASLLINERF